MPGDIFTINPDMIQQELAFKLLDEKSEWTEPLTIMSFLKNDKGEILIKSPTIKIVFIRKGKEGFYEWNLISPLIVRNCLPMKMKLSITNIQM